MFEVSPKVATVVSVVVAVICLVGAVIDFAFGSDNGVVLGILFLGLAALSLVLGAMIRHQQR